RTVRSPPPETSRPSGVNATLRTSFLWPMSWRIDPSMLEEKLLVPDQRPQDVLDDAAPLRARLAESRSQHVSFLRCRQSRLRGQEQLVDDVSVGSVGGDQAGDTAVVVADGIVDEPAANEVQRLTEVRVGVALALAGHRPRRPAERLQERML